MALIIGVFVNDEKRSCGEVKNFKAAARCNGVKPAGLIVTIGGD